MRKYSKRIFNRVKKITNDIFSDAAREVLGLQNETVEDLQSAMDFLRMARVYQKSMPEIYTEQEVTEMIEAKEQVDNLYLEKMIALPTKDLEDIILVHEKGVIVRHSRTMESITSELARRAILNDSSESDHISTHGAVDGIKTKVKSRRKRPKITRNRTSKGR